MKEKIGTIDATPTWSGILPALLVLIENGSPGASIARDELKRMAQLADLYVASQKEKAGN